MGKRGPRKTPTVLRVLRGNPSGRRLPVNEPMPRPLDGDIAPPEWLSEPARVEWRRLAPLLAKNGLLTELDLDALAAYCVAFVEWRDADAMICKFGAVVRSPSNFPLMSPYVPIAGRAFERMRRMMAEFGMSPAARTNIARTTPPIGPDNPLDRFIRR